MSVIWSQEGAIGRLTIDRPERGNALDATTVLALLDGLAEAARIESVRVIVLSGEGERAFCAGGDLSSLADGPFLAQHEGRARYAKLLLALSRSPVPVIARVNGDAMGGGLGLALACDLVIAVEHARFGTPELRVGLFPMMIMALLLRNMPEKRARELMLTGGRLSAAEALAAGAINRVVPVEQLDRAVRELAETIACYSPAALRLGREALVHMRGMELESALHYLNAMLTVVAGTDDAAEGLSAFLEKRLPDWQGS